MLTTTTKRRILEIFFGVVIPIIIGILVHYFVRPSPPKQYSTLTEISEYAKTLPELPLADNKNWEDPVFETFYKTRTPGLLGIALQQIGMWKEPPFSPRYMAQLMEELSEENYRRGMKNGTKNFIHIKANGPTKIILFGDLHAAFHSFIRDLNHLKQLGLLNEDLTLTDKNTFMVFNGNNIDRAPYSIDTLILMCLLLKNNPEKVFYVAGRHERDGFWFDYSLRRELIVRASYYSQQTIPFSDQILGFFKTLPEAVYISGKDDTHEAMRIAFFGRDGLRFDEADLDPSFLTQKETVSIDTFRRRQPNEKPFDVRVAIKTEEWRNENRIHLGLGQLDQDHGASTWAVLCSPIMVNRLYLGFYNDAFTIISIDKVVRDATIALNYQDTRIMEGFHEQQPKNLISGQIQDHAQINYTLALGSTMSLVRGLPLVGEQLVSGANLRINQFNKKVNNQGVIIRYFLANDNHISKLARENVIQDINRGVKYFLLPMRGESVQFFMDVIDSSKSGVFFPATGETVIRTEKMPNVINFRSSYVDEARALIQVMTQGGSSRRFAIFYEADTFTGQETFSAAVKELSRLGIHDVIALPYFRGSYDYQDQVTKLKKAAPDALGFFALPDAMKELIRQVGIETLTSPNLFAFSRTNEIHMKKYLQRKGLAVTFGSPVPDPWGTDLKIAELHRKAITEIGGLVSIHSFEAYIATSLLLEAVQKVGSAKLSPQNVMKVFENMKDYDFHGMKLTFDKKTRSLANYVWVEPSDPYAKWKRFSIKELAK